MTQYAQELRRARRQLNRATAMTRKPLSAVDRFALAQVISRALGVLDACIASEEEVKHEYHGPG